MPHESIVDNPLVMLIEESIHLRNSAQEILSEALGDQTLSRLERLVLISLAEAGSPLTISQVGRNLGHPRQVIQRASNQLLELGLIEKLPNPAHKTSALLRPTARGAVFEERMGKKLLELVNSLFTEKDIANCRRVLQDLKKLREVIESHAPRDEGRGPNRRQKS